MQTTGRRESDMVEDIRGRRGPARRGGVAISGGTILLLLVVSVVTGRNPLELLQMIETVPAPYEAPSEGDLGAPVDDEGSRFVRVVLGNTEDVWNQVLPQTMQRPYRLPHLVLFSDAVDSACGHQSAAVGPFYCPLDAKVYVDLGFFHELDRRFGAPGDFAQAYVIAHEVGHHVQNLLGISTAVHQARQRMSESDGNALSVLAELQADCFAGVWGFHANRTHRMLEPGDAEEGLKAAAAIGDDTLQRRSGGRVQPESWTHGSSQQRVTWLRRGLQTGDPRQCDTFEGSGWSPR